MKQAAFDNILKVASILMVGYFLFLMTKMTLFREPSDEGRYKFINQDEGFILDSKTGYLYKSYDRIKN